MQKKSLDQSVSKSEIIECKKAIFNLRFQKIQDPKADLSKVKETRRKIARHLTSLKSA